MVDKERGPWLETTYYLRTADERRSAPGKVLILRRGALDELPTGAGFVGRPGTLKVPDLPTNRPQRSGRPWPCRSQPQLRTAYLAREAQPDNGSCEQARSADSLPPSSPMAMAWDHRASMHGGLIKC